jgi:hypothetical protein
MLLQNWNIAENTNTVPIIRFMLWASASMIAIRKDAARVLSGCVCMTQGIMVSEISLPVCVSMPVSMT